MKKITKITAICLVMLTAFMLMACGGPITDVFYFQNDCGAEMDGFHVSSTTADDWGEPLNLSSVSKGSKITLGTVKLTDGVGASYDIGAIDHNGMNYEFYDVPINELDILAIGPAEGDSCTLTVTSADGNTQTYEGYAYQK